MPRTLRTLRVVAIGGGTGLPNVLRGLRPLLYGAGRRRSPDPAGHNRLVAVVTMSDDGGSSGALRKDFGVLPPGDVRNCLAALSDNQARIAELFQYRFHGHNGLDGHALGNLLLTALADVTRDFTRAVQIAADVLGVRGTVLPATTEQVTLVADLADGRSVSGETSITAAGAPIRRLRLSPSTPQFLPEVIEAILRADVVVIGPGSTYTSILPPLLVPSIGEALERTRAARIFVLNLMTEPGETDGFDGPDHLRVLSEHLGGTPCDYTLYNSASLHPDLAADYGARGAAPLAIGPADVEAFARVGVKAVGAALAAEQPAGKIRHHPGALAKAIIRLARAHASQARTTR